MDSAEIDYAKRQVYETYTADEVTEEMLADAARLFNANYGVWAQSTKRAGQRVQLTAQRLRKQCLPDGSNSCYVRVVIDDTLAGNAFACRWEDSTSKHRVCWITQLVVSKQYRRRGVASQLLRQLRSSETSLYGIMSSHPAACMAAAAAYCSSIDNISIPIIEDGAAVMKTSPIDYVKNAKLCGSAFDPDSEACNTEVVVSAVDTSFFVDHEEPLNVLEEVKKSGRWPLGELKDGYEFLLLLPGEALTY